MLLYPHAGNNFVSQVTLEIVNTFINVKTMCLSWFECYVYRYSRSCIGGLLQCSYWLLIRRPLSLICHISLFCPQISDTANLPSGAKIHVVDRL